MDASPPVCDKDKDVGDASICSASGRLAVIETMRYRRPSRSSRADRAKAQFTGNLADQRPLPRAHKHASVPHRSRHCELGAGLGAPDNIARVYLGVIERNPEAVAAALEE
jgi:hypothetical protein